MSDNGVRIFAEHINAGKKPEELTTTTSVSFYPISLLVSKLT